MAAGQTRLLLLGLLLLLGEAAGLALQWRRQTDPFIVAVLLQAIVWSVAAILVRRGARPSFALILAVAALLRIGALAAPPYLSTDIYRYIWDGRVAAAGINPYRYIPDDPHLASLRDAAVFPNINRAVYAPTAYPPAAQMLFLLATRFGGTVPAMKLFMVAIEAVGVCALLAILRMANMPRETILLYLWHPLPVWEIAGSGHVDAAVVMFVALALAAAVAGRHAVSGVALAAATLVKFIPAVLIPALWRPSRANRGDWRWPAAFAATIILAYLPYLGAGRRVLGFLPGYLNEEKFASGGGFWLLGLARRAFPVPVALYIGLAAIVMAGLAIAALHRAADPLSSLRCSTILASAALFFLSPHYAWYFVWLVPLLCVAPWWPAWWPTLTAILLYKQSATGQIPLPAGLAVYGGFAALGGADILRRSIVALRLRSAA